MEPDDRIAYTLYADGTVRITHVGRRGCASSVLGPVTSFTDDDGHRDIRMALLQCTAVPDPFEISPGSEHLPFGCTDEDTPPGDYWMYPGEADVTDPIPPLADRIGIREWTLHLGSGREETFTGDMEAAMGRLEDAIISEATDAVGRRLLGDGGSDGGRAWIVADDGHGVCITSDIGELTVWANGRDGGCLSRIGALMFTQKND